MSKPVKERLCVNCQKRFDRNVFDLNRRLCRPCQVISLRRREQSVARYQRSDKRKENKRRAQRRYYHSPKGQTYYKQWAKSEAGKKTFKRFAQSEKGKKYFRAWKKTINGRGGNTSYGKFWPIISDAIRKRDDFTCQACGKKQEAGGKRFPVDHKFPYLLGGEHKANNLQTLCFACHAKKTGAEKKLRKGNILGYRQWLNRHGMAHVSHESHGAA